MSSRLNKKMSKLTKEQTDTYVNIDIPYDLKDELKERFQIRWVEDDQCWSCKKSQLFQFDRNYLTEYPTPSKAQKQILRDEGAHYDKTKKLYYFLFYQEEDARLAEDTEDDEVDAEDA